MCCQGIIQYIVEVNHKVHHHVWPVQLAEKVEMGKGAREQMKICNAQIVQEKKNEKFRKKLKHFLVAQEKRGIKVVQQPETLNNI